MNYEYINKTSNITSQLYLLTNSAIFIFILNKNVLEIQIRSKSCKLFTYLG